MKVGVNVQKVFCKELNEMSRSSPKNHVCNLHPHRAGRWSQVPNFFLGTVIRGGVVKMTFLCRSGHFMQSLANALLPWGGGLASITFL